MYASLIQEIVDEARKKEDVIGVLLIGSVAREDAHPGADLDVRILLRAENSQDFLVEMREGVLIERGYADVARAQEKLKTNPMEVYAYLDGRILFDPERMLAQLRELAKEIFDDYHISEQERYKIAYWLKSTHLKMTVALKAGDLLKAAFVASTSSWEILCGLWAVNDRPMPPNGSVWPHLKDLAKGPPDAEKRLVQLFCGETEERIHAAIDLINWIDASLRINDH